MSGFIGILNTDGAPIDEALLQRITQFMAFRGPDAQQTWHDGAVGFGHAMLRTTHEQEREQQPCSLDGKTWITADARVDGRADLLRALIAAGRQPAADTADVELILHAYHAWGEDCVQHLIGDFAFAIWDGAARKLLCARDHFGVRPFYYAQAGTTLVCSNTLNSVRMHPAVSADLNEVAIGDFLLFNYNREFDITFFANIRQLVPAHTLIWCDGALRIQRYWTLPVEEELQYKQPTDYVERYRELLQQAVGDRLRTNRVSIFLSGGLDSTSIAAAARQLHAQDGDPFALHAITFAYGDALDDREPQHAALVAQALNIPIHYFDASHYHSFDRWEEHALCTPEPINNPLLAMRVDALREASSHGRVLLSGDGGDSVFYPSSRYFIGLLKNMRIGKLVSDIRAYAQMYGQRPPLYFASHLLKKLGLRKPQAPYPVWLNASFVERAKLDARWKLDADDPPQVHPTRYEAYQTLTDALWLHRFSNLDAGVTQIPLEARFPFFDIRLVAYLLRVPPMPWFVQKHLPRMAMAGILPEPVRTRPKASFAHLRDDLPTTEQILAWSEMVFKAPSIDQWIDVESYHQPAQRLLHLDPSVADSETRPACLAWWLCCNNSGILAN